MHIPHASRQLLDSGSRISGVPQGSGSSTPRFPVPGHASDSATQRPSTDQRQSAAIRPFRSRSVSVSACSSACRRENYPDNPHRSWISCQAHRLMDDAAEDGLFRPPT